MKNNPDNPEYLLKVHGLFLCHREVLILWTMEVKNMPTDKPRFTVIVDQELMKRIDDFRFDNRYNSRSAAALELIRLGLEAFENQPQKAKDHNKTARDK